jgi:hypothetical protein
MLGGEDDGQGDGPSKSELVASLARETSAKEAERAAREAETAAKEALLLRVARLEARLGEGEPST